VKKSFLFFFLYLAALHGDECDILIPCLRGIFLSSPCEEEEEIPCEGGIWEKGLCLSDREFAKLEKRLINRYLDQPLSVEGIHFLKKDILEFYRSIGRPIVIVQIPEQDITSEVLVVEIQESKVGDLCVIGANWSSPNRILNFVRVRDDGLIDSRRLATDLAWLNQNPYRSVNAVFKAGRQPCTTDIELLVCEKRPYSVFAGTDNTGFRETGYVNVFAGFNWGNVFGLGHILSYEYIISTEFNRYQGHAVNYIAPLPWRHTFQVFGGYSFVHVPHLQKTFKNHGKSLQVSGRYQIPLPSYRDFLQEFRFGADYKHTNNSVEFGGFNIINHYVNILQAMAGYKFTYQSCASKAYFDLEAFGSPCRWLPDMSPHYYSELRADAKPWYIYARGTFTYQYKLPKQFLTDFRLRGQLSSANLLPSEQMGLGGYNTVRGYLERQVNVDDALIANLEFRTPTWCPFRRDAFVLLAFADYALGVQHERQSFEKQVYNLLGVGPGIRYQIDHWFLLRADLGCRLIKTQNDASHSVRVHFGAVLNY